ncbi:hypothetical protein HYALB_00001397 [Hymenoscyphus albidus]|uniref:F-box domain-containing protein n=1 Tax=Hymenoscyphus albidus TaxID=595503 RepID=A0A9N9PQE4_9HELO|nr:hypothetical protein HYALB_00001397 [Hymenoscyphus albidus]
MQIYELPVELFSHILSQFTVEEGWRTLPRLALTCHALSKLVKPFLYKNLTIRIGTPASQTQWYRLLRTLQEQPVSGTFVRSVSMGTIGVDDMLDLGLVNHLGREQHVFSLFSDIREMTARSDTFALLPMVRASASTSRASLTKLCLYADTTSNLQILDFMDFPKLQAIDTISLRYFKFDASEIYCTDTNDVLRSLRLGARAQMDSRALESIISRCAGLKILEASIPLDDIKPFPFGPSWRYISYPMSPPKISSILTPLSRTLTRLRLSGERQIWYGHDGTKLDLSTFVLLEDLEIFSLCLLPPTGKDFAPHGMYKLLPQSLKKLHLHFTFNQSKVFWYPHDSSATPNGTGQSKDPLCWITELVENKPKCFPSLQTVILDNTGPITPMGPSCNSHPLYLHLRPGIELDWAWDDIHDMQRLYQLTSISLVFNVCKCKESTRGKTDCL